MNIVFDLLKYIDVMGYEPKLLINKKNKIKTTFGGLITFFYWIVMLIFCFYSFLELFTYKNIYISFNEEKNQSPRLNYSGMPLFFQILNTSTTQISFAEANRYFSFNAFIYKINLKLSNNNSSEISIKKVNIGYCSDFYSIMSGVLNNNVEKDNTIKNLNLKDEIFNLGDNNIPTNILNEYDKNINLNGYQNENREDYSKYFSENFNTSSIIRGDQIPMNRICIDPNDIIDLYGVLGDDNNQSFLRIDVLQCKNTTQFNECFPQDVIIEKVKYSNFIVRYLDYNINNRNVTYPGEPYLKGENFLLSPLIRKSVHYSIRNVDYSTDFAILGNELSTLYFHKFEEVKLTTDLLDKQYSIFLTLDFSMSQIKIKYFRSYSKFQNVLASLSAISSICLFVSRLISAFYSEIVYYGDIIEYLGLYKIFKNDYELNPDTYKNNIFGKRIRIEKINSFANKKLNANLSVNSVMSNKLDTIKNTKIINLQKNPAYHISCDNFKSTNVNLVNKSNETSLKKSQQMTGKNENNLELNKFYNIYNNSSNLSLLNFNGQKDHLNLPILNKNKREIQENLLESNESEGFKSKSNKHVNYKNNFLNRNLIDQQRRKSMNNYYNCLKILYPNQQESEIKDIKSISRKNSPQTKKFSFINKSRKDKFSIKKMSNDDINVKFSSNLINNENINAKTNDVVFLNSLNATNNLKFQNLNLGCVRETEKNMNDNYTINNKLTGSPDGNKHMNKNENKHFFNITKILCKKFCNRNSIESNLFVRTENYIKKKLSLEEIIKKLYDVDKLKFAFFNEDMLNLFSCIPNPNFITKKENKNSVINNRNGIFFGQAFISEDNKQGDYTLKRKLSDSNNTKLKEEKHSKNMKETGTMIFDMWNKYEFFRATKENIKRGIFNFVEVDKKSKKGKNILNLLKI